MPTTLRTFAATLAAVGLLSIGSFTMGQQETDQPPSDPSSIENIEESADVAEIRPADESESARPDTPPADPNNPNNSAEENSPEAEADRNSDAPQENAENASDTPDATNEGDNADANRGDSDDADRSNSENNASDDNAADADNADNNREENRDKADENKELSPPEVPEQARDRDANARQDVNADWRMVEQEGTTWFYSPSGQWHIRQGNNWQAYHDGMHYGDLNRQRDIRGDRSVVINDGRAMQDGSQRYSSGYRGEEVYHTANGEQRAQNVRYDRCGRAYICVNGRAVYVDVSESSQEVQYSDERQPTMADEQYQDVPPPPAMDGSDNGDEQRGDAPAPPAPPSGA